MGALEEELDLQSRGSWSEPQQMMPAILTRQVMGAGAAEQGFLLPPQ